ncbi:MAG TPA: glycosyltransferase family 39 protein [Candidatus Binatia bacterium]|nr:glycosyltransferase family 39 protein [Candidatus Binatia bacterium]
MKFAADLRAWLREPRVRGLLIALVWLLLALHRLGDDAIVGDDEAREVGIVQDVLAGHWLWPLFNRELLPDKPTLSHWLGALACAPAGFSETAVRLPSVLAAAGTIWWTVEFGSRLLGPPAGLAAGLVLATTRSFFAHARVARPDTLLVLLVSAALGCAWRWWREGSRRHATAALALLGLGALAKGPVGPALFAAAFGLFLLWQRELRRVFQLCTPAGIAAFLVLGLGWYALAWAGWGHTFVEQHVLGRYVRNLVGGLATGHAYSPRPWYYHLFFYPQHLPAIVWPWTPFVAVALWELWRQGGLRDPRARFLLCWAVAPVLVFTPAEWKLRYYLLPCLPPLALLTGPLLVRLVRDFLVPQPVTRASLAASAAFVVAVSVAALVYIEHPTMLSESDRLTRDAILSALGGVQATAALIGVMAGMLAVVIACRAWGGVAVLVAAASAIWLAAGEPALDVATSGRDSLKAFARQAAALFPPERPLAFYGPTIRPVVVYVGRPVPSLDRRRESIVPGQGVIAFEPAYRKLAGSGVLGPPLATASGRTDNVERKTVVLAEAVRAGTTESIPVPGGAGQLLGSRVLVHPELRSDYQRGRRLRVHGRRKEPALDGMAPRQCGAAGGGRRGAHRPRRTPAATPARRAAPG